MTVSLPNPSRFVPYWEVGNRENIIVDGAPLDSTILTLSHWPNNHTPDVLKQDTSTATVFAYLDTPELHQNIDIVSNNHFDEDGLFGMFALCHPVLALQHRELLIGGAMAGDFGVYTDRNSARLCFVIEAMTDKTTSPLSRDSFSGCERQQVSAFYRKILERLPDILVDLDAYREFWEAQDLHLDESERLIADGTVSIEEFPDDDLAVVTIPDDLPPRQVRRYLNTEQASIHPFAIHTATRCNRIIRVQNGGFEFQYRYESWVQFVSRRPLFRVALNGLVIRLNALEQAAGSWRCESVTNVVPRLFLEGTNQSSLSVDEFVSETQEYLRSQPIAWDPFDWEPS